MRDFGPDPHSGAPRILFVGWSHSSHAHGWIRLLDGAGFNVRFFALPLGLPPDGWPVRTYITRSTPRAFDRDTRIKLYACNKLGLFVQNRIVHALHGPDIDAPRLALAQVLRRWRPHVVHALGIDPAGLFYRGVRERFGLLEMGRWIQHIWGGSDLELTLPDPAKAPGVLSVLRECDVLVTDTAHNITIAAAHGVDPAKFRPLTPIAGNGGIDVDALRARWDGPPSARRDVLWPKAYECIYSKALPVFEALRRCEGLLAGRKVRLLAMNDEAREWFRALPESLRNLCAPLERIPHGEALELMTGARVMLAPSLIDGFPNSLHEAMACGAVPIVSPLATITAHITADNALFARNLYPDEIAGALALALAEDSATCARLDAMAERNLALVRQTADHPTLAPRVRRWYAEQAAACQGRSAPGGESI